ETVVAPGSAPALSVVEVAARQQTPHPCRACREASNRTTAPCSPRPPKAASALSIPTWRRCLKITPKFGCYGIREPFVGDRFYRAVTDPKEAKMATGSRCVALLPIHYAARDDRWKWNIVQSIRTRTLLRQAHPAKILDGDFHLRTATEMTGLF